MRWARRHKSSQALALRSRIILGCAQGLSNKAVAEHEEMSQPTVGKWRALCRSTWTVSLMIPARGGHQR